MDYQQQIEHIRANANAEVIDAILAASPHTDEIGPREYLSELLWPKLSSNDDIRRREISNFLETYRAKVDDHCRRYNALRTHGIAALSDYDLGIAYRGIGPERGLASALRAVANHIACVRAQVAWLEAEQARLVPPQLALF